MGLDKHREATESFFCWRLNDFKTTDEMNAIRIKKEGEIADNSEKIANFTGDVEIKKNKI